MEVNDNMRYAVDPRQKALFDPAETMFSPRWLSTWLNLPQPV